MNNKKTNKKQIIKQWLEHRFVKTAVRKLCSVSNVYDYIHSYVYIIIYYYTRIYLWTVIIYYLKCWHMIITSNKNNIPVKRFN